MKHDRAHGNGHAYGHEAKPNPRATGEKESGTGW